jgi:Asp-tRNA(Asn)/Glu-tRNA(Gln) amidotransferase B subunit
MVKITDKPLLHLIKLGLIGEKLAQDIQAIMIETGQPALEVIWRNGLKHAVDQGTIIDHYCKFMDEASLQ